MMEHLSPGARHILEAAEPLLAERGYDGVSILDIARQANVSKANIYHHFASKDALYLAVVKYAFQDMADLLAELAEESTSPETQLANFAEAHLKFLFQHPNVPRLILRELLNSKSQRGRSLAEQVFSDNFARLSDIIRRGQQAGRLRSNVDAGHMAISVAGMNVFLFLAWPAIQHLPEGTFSNPEASGRAMFDILLGGMLQHENKPKEKETGWTRTGHDR